MGNEGHNDTAAPFVAEQTIRTGNTVAALRGAVFDLALHGAYGDTWENVDGALAIADARAGARQRLEGHAGGHVLSEARVGVRGEAGLQEGDARGGGGGETEDEAGRRGGGEIAIRREARGEALGDPLASARDVRADEKRVLVIEHLVYRIRHRVEFRPSVFENESSVASLDVGLCVVNAFAAAPPHRATALTPVRETLATLPHASRCVPDPHRAKRSSRSLPGVPPHRRTAFRHAIFSETFGEFASARPRWGERVPRVARRPEPAAESSLSMSP